MLYGELARRCETMKLGGQPPMLDVYDGAVVQQVALRYGVIYRTVPINS